jgi:thiol-disulfide isomerase/thioredoxin
MTNWIGLGLIAFMLQVPQASPAERKIVEYLKANVKPNRPVVVSDLYNSVFKSPEERKVLDRLFNTFFKIPIFVVQFNESTKKIPTLKDISEQFHLPVPGEADVLLRIMEADPRVPKLLDRNPKTGEITRIDTVRIKANPQFSRALDRTITGWEGKAAPFFRMAGYDGKPVTTQQVFGQPYLIYFWFTNCPPCLKTAPILSELQNTYASKGFKIVAANADGLLELPYDNKARADYVQKAGLKFTMAVLNAETQRAFGGVSVFPTMFFVDKRGVVVKQFLNEQGKASLDAAIQQALK